MSIFLTQGGHCPKCFRLKLGSDLHYPYCDTALRIRLRNIIIIIFVFIFVFRFSDNLLGSEVLMIPKVIIYLPRINSFHIPFHSFIISKSNGQIIYVINQRLRLCRQLSVPHSAEWLEWLARPLSFTGLLAHMDALCLWDVLYDVIRVISELFEAKDYVYLGDEEPTWRKTWCEFTNMAAVNMPCLVNVPYWSLGGRENILPSLWELDAYLAWCDLGFYGKLIDVCLCDVCIYVLHYSSVLTRLKLRVPIAYVGIWEK